MGKTKRNYGKERRARADRRKLKDLREEVAEIGDLGRHSKPL